MKGAVSSNTKAQELGNSRVDAGATQIALASTSVQPPIEQPPPSQQSRPRTPESKEAGESQDTPVSSSGLVQCKDPESIGAPASTDTRPPIQKTPPSRQLRPATPKSKEAGELQDTSVSSSDLVQSKDSESIRSHTSTGVQSSIEKTPPSRQSRPTTPRSEKAGESRDTPVSSSGLVL